MKGWIIIPRDILDEKVFRKPNVFNIFVNLLMRASWSDHEYNGVQLKEGQVVTTLNQIAEWCNLSIQNVRTVLLTLKLTNLLTQESTHQSTTITICNYGSYKLGNLETEQPSNKPANSVTNKHKKEKINKEEIIKKKINKRKKDEDSITKLIEREHNRVLNKSKKVESEVNRIEDMIKFVEENPNSTALGVLKNLKTSGRLKELGITWQEKN
jgi:hypothetical protein